VIDIEHTAPGSLFINCLLGLFLRSDEEDNLPFGDDIANELVGFFEELDGLLKINDVNPISRPEDIGLHFGVPAFCLMAEMDSSLQQFFHRYSGHRTLRFFSINPPLDEI